jgi:hypothetical protein
MILSIRANGLLREILLSVRSAFSSSRNDWMGSKLQMLTGRSAKYVEAMIREGNDFDYFKWLRRVQQEEAQLKSVAVSTSVQPIAPGANQPGKIVRNLGQFSASKTADREKHKPAVGRAIQEAGHRAKSVGKPKKSLRQRLGDVCNAWDDFQENRDRDAVYGYLSAVFSIVKHYNGRRRTKRLLRRAFKFAGLPVDIRADPFAVVIRSTCEHKLDNKTVSKWSRALRYVARVKKPRHPLTAFMKNRGGVNACAGLFAKELGRHSRSSRQK